MNLVVEVSYQLAALRTATIAPVWAWLNLGKYSAIFKPPADDSKTLAKRFAGGGNRTRDLQHGNGLRLLPLHHACTVILLRARTLQRGSRAFDHYTTRPHSNLPRALTVGAGPKSKF